MLSRENSIVQLKYLFKSNFLSQSVICPRWFILFYIREGYSHKFFLFRSLDLLSRIHNSHLLCTVLFSDTQSRMEHSSAWKWYFSIGIGTLATEPWNLKPTLLIVTCNHRLPQHGNQSWAWVLWKVLKFHKYEYF